MTGPVQVLVVGFDRPTFSGEVLAEFTRLREAGIVRLVDLLVVSRTEDGAFETVGGYVLSRVGRVPAVGERFEFEGLDVEILEAERRRIHKVRLRRRPATTDEEATA